MCLRRPREAADALEAGLRRVGASACLQEALAAVPGLAASAAAAGRPGAPRPGHAHAAACEAGAAPREAAGAPRGHTRPPAAARARSRAYKSKQPACVAGRRTGKLPVAVLSGFLGAGCGARLARAAAARARAGLTRAARAAQEEHAEVAPPGEPERPAGAPALRAAPCSQQRRRATHRRHLVFRQLFGSTYGSK